MKPAPFAYHAPATLNEALALLSEHEGTAKILAGGQSLLPLLYTRAVSADVLIDIGSLRDLAHIRVEHDGHLSVGALASIGSLLAERTVAIRWPLLTTAAARVGHRAVRNRGTIGGSLAHADPAAELCVAAVALDAELRITSPRGVRDVPAAAFLRGRFETDLRHDEVLTDVRFPLPVAGSGHAWAEHARRYNDPALVGVAAMVRLDEQGRCSNARLVYGGVADRPFEWDEAASLLAQGEDLDAAIAAEAGRRASAVTDPPSDARASQRYRKHLVESLTRRALLEAAGHARDGGVPVG